jgi:hypothetical protein
MRAWLMASVLCGCTSGGADSSPCAGDPLVATWSRSAQDQTWAIHDDCTWSLTRQGTEQTGTWSRSGANATFAFDAPSHTPATTVTPERVGDRLAVQVVYGSGPQLAPPLVSSTAIYGRLSYGDGLAGSLWGRDRQTPDQGGSCSYFQESDRITLLTDGTGTQTFSSSCQPANMPFTQTWGGTWAATGDAGDFTFQITTPSNAVGSETWARFGASIATDFFVRVP